MTETQKLIEESTEKLKQLEQDYFLNGGRWTDSYAKEVSMEIQNEKEKLRKVGVELPN